MNQLSRSVRRGLTLAALATTVPLGIAPAYAEMQGLEEVVVTAQKMEQNLSETPMSISVLTSKDLEALGAVQFRDFASGVPGLEFTTTGVGQTQVNMRGITTGANIAPTVGIYVDEVPYGSTTPFAGGASLALDAGLFDLSRVEVLRGPQGTLYGASTMGGLLKYVTVVPDVNEFGGRARAGISTTEDGGTAYDVAAVVNMPFLSDKAAVRVSGFESHDGGFIDNTVVGKDNVTESDVYGGRGDFLFQPTDALSIRLTAFLQNISRDGANSADFNLSNSKPIGDGLEQTSALLEPFTQQFGLFSGTVNYDFGSMDLTSVTSYQSMDAKAMQDATFLYGPFCGAVIAPGCVFDQIGVKANVYTDKFAQEVRLAGQGSTLDWLAGFFYTHENSQQAQTLPAWGPNGSGFNDGLDLLTAKIPSTYDETAGFGTLTWHITDKWDVAGGLRYAHISQDQEQIASGTLGALVGSYPKKNSTDDVTTYLADLRYRPTDNVMAYFRFATGYRPGGPNLVLYDFSGQPLAPDTYKSDSVDSYEIGLKASTDDRRYNMDLAVYDIDWTDIQIATSVDGFNVVGNGKTARSTGAELTLTAIPVPELTLVGAFGYIDAKLTAAAPSLGGTNGERLPNTPDFTAAVSGDYSFNVAEHQSSAGVLLRYIDDRTSGFDGAQSPNYDLPDYTTVELRGSFDFGPAMLRLYVRNLFDERGQQSAGGTLQTLFGLPATVSVIQPRTYGMSIDVNF